MNEIVKKNGINFGIILGIAGILSQIIVYVLGGITKENTILGSIIQIVFWIIYLVIRIIQATKTKKELNGFATFKDIFTTLTITITIGILISQLFTYTLNNFIDVDYGTAMNEFMNEQQIVASKAMQSITKVTDEELREISNTDNFSLIKILQGSVIAFLISSIMNLILAAIFKRKPQELI